MAENEKIRVCLDTSPAASAPEELALMNKWPSGKRLRVRFLDGDEFLRRKVMEYAKQWEQHANIKFEQSDDEDAEIRVSFTPNGLSWSALGTDALQVAKDQPTMNYGWFNQNTPEEEFSRTTLHEFGHALGCIHEHQNPAGGIPWNREAVYRFYEQTQGWPRDRVDHNLFRKFEIDQSNHTEFDRDSIMLYPVPKELTDGVFEVGWNRKLSETDKRFIGEMYP